MHFKLALWDEGGGLFLSSSSRTIGWEDFSIPIELPWNILLKIKLFTNGLPRWHSGKESACQCRRRQFDLWVRKIPWRRKWQPALVFLPGKFHGQRALTGYTVHGVAELYITYQLSNNSIYKHTHIFFIVLCRYYIVFCFVLQMEGWW